MITFKYKNKIYYTTYNNIRIFKTTKKFFYFDKEENKILELKINEDIKDFKKIKDKKNMILDNSIYESIITNKILNKNYQNSYLFECLKAFHFNVLKKDLKFIFFKEEIRFNFNDKNFILKYDFNGYIYRNLFLKEKLGKNKDYFISTNTNLLFNNMINSCLNTLFNTLGYLIEKSKLNKHKYINIKNIDSIFNTEINKILSEEYVFEENKYDNRFFYSIESTAKEYKRMNFNFEHLKEILNRIKLDIDNSIEKSNESLENFKKESLVNKIKTTRELKEKYNFDVNLLENKDFMELLSEHRHRESNHLDNLNFKNKRLINRKERMKEFEERFANSELYSI